jgi:hypothetical protein
MNKIETALKIFLRSKDKDSAKNEIIIFLMSTYNTSERQATKQTNKIIEIFEKSNNVNKQQRIRK